MTILTMRLMIMLTITITHTDSSRRRRDSTRSDCPFTRDDVVITRHESDARAGPLSVRGVRVTIRGAPAAAAVAAA